MTDPSKNLLIDNIDNKLSNILHDLFNSSKLTESAKVKIASAFFSPAGFIKISEPLTKISKVQILLGTEPNSNKGQWDKKLEETETNFINRQLQESIENQDKYIKNERDYFPFNQASSSSVKKMLNALKIGNIEVRRYEKSFLHAKAYLYKEDEHPENSVIIGSSNLTANGLSANLELNVSNHDPEVIKETEQWFDRLWDESVPFNLASYFEEIFTPRDPFVIFLKVLWELYGEEVLEEFIQDKKLPLTNFQKHGVERALRLIDQCGGVIVADEVGLGKTFIAGEILTRYMDKRQRALLICPAAIRDNTWRQFKADFQLYIEVVSFEQLANDESLKDKQRPNANQQHLERSPDEYQLIIVDEAHNYRNPDAPYRAAALRRLLYGKRKDVLFLTATPVNNSLWDLFYLTQFFIKQDSFLADKGILSIRDRFNQATKQDPRNLSPDLLYPIIDATTVKRTRQFIKKYYENDYIKDADGNQVPIIFPSPNVISIRYNLDAMYPNLFNIIEDALDSESDNQLTFARYKVELYSFNKDEEEGYRSASSIGLIKTGILKRFESSGGAFKATIRRLIDHNESFLKALQLGQVVTTAFLNDLSINNDEDFDQLLELSEDKRPIENYDQELLKKDIEHDLTILNNIESEINHITPEKDPKLKALVASLIDILNQADDESIDGIDFVQKRKVLIFSFFSDSVHWIRDFLIDEINNNPLLHPYKNRIKSVSGTGDGDDANKRMAVEQFAPESSGSRTGEDLVDILITTDVLAEGVNLQQCRHIVNYDMPWNPMRLVQRHGRIDRIGSKHKEIFLRTIFPADRLDALLHLEERIVNKLAMAASSVGVVSPIENIQSKQQVFSESREEIEKLMRGDASLFIRGGTKSSTQSGEEYRQTLRQGIKDCSEEFLVNLAWKSGSGFKSEEFNGYFFCAKVGDRTYLRLITTDDNWAVLNEEENDEQVIFGEIGTCLRIIECANDTELFFPDECLDHVYEAWESIRDNIWDEWTIQTDPINLQPKVRPLNLKVRDFLRKTESIDTEQKKLERAIDILESPWPRRDENLLRHWFEEDESDDLKVVHLIDNILSSGLEPFKLVEPLPPINKDDIKLIVWMALKKYAP